MSLFAQELKTAEPVSAKRLARALDGAGLNRAASCARRPLPWMRAEAAAIMVR